jgi:exopolyphosphatase / guanosine-5'-triphosphate,3'-diphosphate pyrophosphatase
VRRACIDIGSNTTRLLVADCDGEQLVVVHQEKAFTHVRRGLTTSDEIEADKIAELVAVVGAQLQTARDLGAFDIRGVATAAVRQAANREAVVTALRDSCGLELAILSAEDEARLAFSGAARTLGYVPSGTLGVVDAGGGSCELVVGTVPDRVDWYASFPLGSGELTDEWLPSDPPTAEEIGRASERVRAVLDGVQPPPAARVVAVGGSATSVRRIAGPRLDASAFERVLAVLTAARAADVAERFGLEAERVRLLPAGLLILKVAAERFGSPLEVARGGLREGLLLEAAGV